MAAGDFSFISDNKITKESYSLFLNIEKES
jgi:hypothetical protein